MLAMVCLRSLFVSFSFCSHCDNVNEDTMTHRSKGNRFGALQEPNNSFSLV